MTAPPRSHVPALDGLRAVAVLWVVLHHAWPLRAAVAGPVDAVLRIVVEVGWAGVDLFFVLSGFLITRILLDHRGQRGIMVAFWWRRILRIMPLYYAFLGFLFVLLPALGVYRFQPGPGARLAYATFTSNLWLAAMGGGPRQPAHLWSVAVEEQFYLVWPVFMLLLPARLILPFILSLLAGVPVLRGVLSASGVDYLSLYVLTPTRADGLAWGALLAVLARRPGGLERWRPVARRLGWVAMILMVMMGGTGFEVTPEVQHPLFQALIYLTTGLAFACLVTVVLTDPPTARLSQWLSRPAMRAIGRWSYAIYVLHPIVMVILIKRGWRPTAGDVGQWWYIPGVLGFTVVAGAISIALGAMSWSMLESRALALKDRVPYPPRRAEIEEI